MTEAVIALGANLGEPKKALEQALKRISKIEQTILLKVSSFIARHQLILPDRTMSMLLRRWKRNWNRKRC